MKIEVAPVDYLPGLHSCNPAKLTTFMPINLPATLCYKIGLNPLPDQWPTQPPVFRIIDSEKVFLWEQTLKRT